MMPQEPNKPDAARPAIASRVHVERHRRGSADPGRSAEMHAMKVIIAILWVQVALGAVGAFLASGHIHMSAMGRAFSYGMRHDYEQARQSPGYHESPPVRGYTTARFIDAMEADARWRGEIAFGAFVGSFGASLLAVLLLFLLRRVRHEHAHTTA